MQQTLFIPSHKNLFFCSLRLLLAIFVVAQVNRAAGQQVKPELERFQLIKPSMGTKIEMVVYSADAEKGVNALEKAWNEVERLVAILGDYDPESELSKLNATAGDATAHPVSEDLWQVLANADRWNRKSRGGFDVAIGGLTQLWRQARASKVLPSAQDIEMRRSGSGWNFVQREEQDHSVRLIHSETKLDLGGIAKGYIVDRAFESIKKHGLESILVMAGGDVRCGTAPPGKPGWRVEVAPAQIGDPPIKWLMLENAAVSTSGDLWQFFEINSVRYSHILDPQLGKPITGPMSITVIAANSTDADAAATALSVLGFESAISTAEQWLGIEALALRREKIGDQEILRYRSTNYFSTGGKPSN